MATDERRLTLIMVPHGDLETRTFEISYRRLKLGIIVTGVLLLLFGFFVASWFPVAAQAGRVGALQRDVVRLEAERGQVAELAQMLAEVEEQYERVRELIGAEAAGRDGQAILPPLRRDTTGQDKTSAQNSATPHAAAGSVRR